MRLIKQCKWRYHPDECGTIQFGSLYYYRSAHEEIRDPKEGIHLARLNVASGSRMELEVASLLLNPHVVIRSEGQVYRESAFAKLNDVSFNNSGDGFIEIEAMKGDIYFNKGNHFIFCMSEDRPDLQVFEQYDSSWSIDRSDVEKFARYVSWQFKKYAPTKLFVGLEVFGKKLRQVPGVSVQIEHRGVSYGERVSDIDQSNIPDERQAREMLEGISFRKESRDKKQYEYRFVVRVFRNGVPVQEKVSNRFVTIPFSLSELA